VTPQPSVSIVVCTLDRAPHLRRLLASLRHLDYPRFEVIVVAGPSTDETDAVLTEFAGQVKVARCREANLSRARNLGVAATAGDLVAFIDDDALPASVRWLAALAAPFALDPALGACGGPVLVGDGSQAEFEGGATSDYGLQAFVAGDLARQGATLDGYHWVARVAGCNCAFRRETLVAIGGFDETFTYYLDESDVCLRLARAGYGIATRADAAVRHYSARSAVRRSFHDLDWRTIARSDTYYALKNGADAPIRRLLTTLQLAPRKHFFRDIGRFRREGHYGRGRWLRYLTRWGAGVVAGLWLGGTRARRLGVPAALTPSPFAQFPRATPERLRVGLIARHYPPHPVGGGIGVYTRELAHGLHALGHEVHVFTESADAVRHEGLRLFVHGIRPEPFPVAARMPTTDRHLRWSLAVAKRVIALARGGFALDVVESPNWECEGVALRRADVVPLVVRLHSPLTAVSAAERRAPSADLEASVRLERWLIANADGVTGSTEGVFTTVHQTMGWNPGRDTLHARIPLGVPSVPDVPPGKGRRLLFVGRLERRKGAHTLLAVLPDLLRRYRDLEVDLVGADIVSPDGDSLRRRFESGHAWARWRRRCRFHGHLDDASLSQLYAACTVFVAPSLYESFGLVYLEAMRYGKAVIGCSTGGIPEVVRDGETGLLVTPDEPQALARAIARLLDDPALCHRLGESARRVVAEEFSSRLMAERTVSFYERVIAARCAGGLHGHELARSPETVRVSR